MENGLFGQNEFEKMVDKVAGLEKISRFTSPCNSRRKSNSLLELGD